MNVCFNIKNWFILFQMLHFSLVYDYLISMSILRLLSLKSLYIHTSCWIKYLVQINIYYVLEIVWNKMMYKMYIMFKSVNKMYVFIHSQYCYHQKHKNWNSFRKSVLVSTINGVTIVMHNLNWNLNLIS